MSIKGLLVLYITSFIVQNISTQCIGAAYNGFAAEGLGWGPIANGLALEAAPLTACNAPLAPEFGFGLRAVDLIASNGRSFAVTSASPIAPTGVSMTSENAYEGPLAVTGAVPFLGAIALEGVLPTAGTGDVTYGCGNGEVAILNEDVAYNSLAGPLGYRDAVPPVGYNGYAGPMPLEAGLVGPAYGFNGARNLGRGCGTL